MMFSRHVSFELIDDFWRLHDGMSKSLAIGVNKKKFRGHVISCKFVRPSPLLEHATHALLLTIKKNCYPGGLSWRCWCGSVWARISSKSLPRDDLAQFNIFWSSSKVVTTRPVFVLLPQAFEATICYHNSYNCESNDEENGWWVYTRPIIIGIQIQG